MPKIETIKRADGSQRYRFTLDVGRDPVTGKRRQRRYTFARMKDARAELGRLTGAVADGTFTDRSRETVSEALDAYLASACFERADNTRVSYTNALLPVRERLGRRKLQSLTRKDIEDLRDWMLAQGRRRGGIPGTPLGPRSARLTLGRLKATLEMACQDGRLAANPARYVRMPAQPRREAATWSEAELRCFLTVADADRLAAAWRLSLYGLRRGEVSGLRWDDVDLTARTVTIGRSRVLVNGKVRRCSDRCNCAGPRRSRTYIGQSGPKESSDSTSNPSLAYHSVLARALATCKIGAMPSLFWRAGMLEW